MPFELCQPKPWQTPWYALKIKEIHTQKVSDCQSFPRMLEKCARFQLLAGFNCLNFPGGSIPSISWYNKIDAQSQAIQFLRTICFSELWQRWKNSLHQKFSFWRKGVKSKTKTGKVCNHYMKNYIFSTQKVKSNQTPCLHLELNSKFWNLNWSEQK